LAVMWVLEKVIDILLLFMFEGLHALFLH
jgi:hypothetical protein